MSPKFSVIRTVAMAAVSTLLVVGLGLALTLAGGGLPGVGDLEDQRAAGAALLPTETGDAASVDVSSAADASPAEDEPAETPTDEPALTPAEQAMNDLVAEVEEQADVQIEAEIADPGQPASTPAPAPVPATVPATAPAPSRARSTSGTGGENLPPATPYSFQLSSFNILGSNHTRPGGSARGYAPGRTRAEWAARVIVDRGVDIVGWSEIQPDQYSAMMRATGNAYEGWPGGTYGYKGTPASLMWRTADFEAVWKGTVTIPFVGQQRPMPIVQLRHRATGRELFVMNVHNSPQGRESERNVAESRELSVVRSLRQESGLPVLLTGDFNEKDEIFCSVTGTTDLVAAAGGSNDGSCRPPGGMRVDWIFGSRDVDFSGYVADQGPSIRRITDHAALFATVTVP